MAKQLAMHEKLEVHEVLTFKTACAAKNKVFSGLAQDPELKAILEEDLELSKKAIKDLRKLLADAEK
ncbi:spore coat protein [Planococcus sp. CPCC 101016]|uniref:spore coat protein n=1 Tax=Planococcus sp. CPCC 101016 TaxID=2599617 RepID=UPI0011B7B0C5|nr:spore coat protein [Planococcus sp. CPCC 101016]TWT05236.1 spore coat protein [Planococcus sp. CPCC 101016]